MLLGTNLVAQRQLVLAETHAAAEALGHAEPVLGELAGELEADTI